MSKMNSRLGSVVLKHHVSSASIQGVIELFQQEFHHSAIDPLGTRWRGHEKRRRSDWEEAAKVCPEWTEDRLEKLLNHPPISA